MDDDETAMPLRITELPALMRCLKAALEMEKINAADKEILRKMCDRINRFAERQGAWWDTQDY